MQQKVLITGAGGPAAISFLRAVEHTDCKFYMGDMDYLGAGLYLVPKQRRVILNGGDSPLFIKQLLDVCKKFQIDVLVPTVDCELLPISNSIDKFKQIGVKVLLADNETLETCLDKHTLFEKCRGSAPVPRSEIFSTNFNDSDWEYPLFAKPRSGSGSRGIKKIDSPDDLKGLSCDGSLLIQEFLPGKEFSVDVLANKEGKVIAAVPRERMKVDSGIAVTSRTIRDKKLEIFAKIFAQKIGLKYTANIQFRYDRNGEPCLLEINPRFPGTMPLTVASGVNMPLHSLREIMDLPNPEEEMSFEEVVMVRTFQEHYVEKEDFEKPKMEESRDFEINAVVKDLQNRFAMSY